MSRGLAVLVGVGAGWHTHLTVLEDVLRGRAPGAFWNTFNPLETQYEKLIRPTPLAGMTAQQARSRLSDCG